MNLLGFITELQNIAAEADRRRAGVWVDQFKKEYPELAEEIAYCAQMDSPKTVLAYLAERNGNFALLKFIPNIEPTIDFLMRFIRERSDDETITSPDVPWTDGRYLPRKSTRRNRSHT